MEIHSSVERVAHYSYSRLIAYLATRSRDLAAAEDALSEAFASALETWPSRGVPQKPEAWRLVAARRKLIDAARRTKRETAGEAALLQLACAAEQRALEEAEFPDERLKLLFVCAHPAIDEAMRAPLMLQVVMGLNATRIATAFVMEPATMGQRLTRAKRKIRDAHIGFKIPRTQDLPGRLEAVLDAIYAAYGSAWDDLAGANSTRGDLAAEAIDLCQLLLRLLPAEPETLGLLSLMLHCEARRSARRSKDGEFIPLSEQNVALWSAPMMAKAEECLRSAFKTGRIGRFQLEAAIQSAHAMRAVTGKTDWESIALLYEGLVNISPSIGARVGRAAAIAEARGAGQGSAILQDIPSETVRTYLPYWALAGHILKRLGRGEEAAAAFEVAISLCDEPAARAFLIQQKQAVTS